MRRIVLAAAATLALLTAGTLTSGRAEAMALSTPVGIRAAIDDTSLTKDVAYVCSRVWRCGYYGCGWRRSCWWSGRSYSWGHRYYSAPRYTWRHRYYGGHRYWGHRYWRHNRWNYR